MFVPLCLRPGGICSPGRYILLVSDVIDLWNRKTRSTVCQLVWTAGTDEVGLTFGEAAMTRTGAGDSMTIRL
jgi:hypothetical protein